jgi:hypothetical protein
MTLIRVAPLAILAVLGFADGAGAQLSAPPPGAMPPCMAEFVPLRTEAEKRGLAIKTAAQHKAPRDQLCQLFRRFTEAEVKVVKFVTEHQAACGIPAEAIASMKSNHTHSMGMQQKICAADVGGGEGKPRGPGLGEALGVRAVPTPETTKTGKGIFDTLSGTQLAQ